MAYMRLRYAFDSRSIPFGRNGLELTGLKEKTHDGLRPSRDRLGTVAGRLSANTAGRAAQGVGTRAETLDTSELISYFFNS